MTQRIRLIRLDEKDVALLLAVAARPQGDSDDVAALAAEMVDMDGLKFLLFRRLADLRDQGLISGGGPSVRFLLTIYGKEALDAYFGRVAKLAQVRSLLTAQL